jgi:dienelactone hydrolase
VSTFCAWAQDSAFSAVSLKSLQTYQYKTSPIVITKIIQDNPEYRAYDFSYTSFGRTVTGRFSLPKIQAEQMHGIIMMLRGHQNAAGYHTGKGTEYPARSYLKAGYAVIAPDFLGYADSDPTPPPERAHQFYSTINAVELYLSLEKSPAFSYAPSVPQNSRAVLPTTFKKIVAWGHSNGGQVAVQFLEVIKKPVPTVLWAPVTRPFPESLVFYRKGEAGWAQQFIKDNEQNDYSLYHYLSQIAPGTPILLEQGTNDKAVPQEWSDKFADAIKILNNTRSANQQINLKYEVYQKANHNLEPYWTTVLTRDAAFWDEH